MMGRPGGGKSVQAKLLAEHIGAQTFSSGMRYRQIATEDSFIGHKVKGIVDSGHLTPSWFAAHLFTESALALPSLESKIVYEGSARKLEEAIKIDEVLTWLERPYAVIYLEVREDEIRARLTKRASLEGRKDDGEGLVDVRLKAYAEDTLPAINYFRDCGKVIEINGNQPESKVFAEIVEKLSHLS